MTPYPSSVPTDDYNLVIGAIKNRSLALNGPEAAKDAWLSVGYGLRVTFGELPSAPSPTDPIPYPASLPTDEILLVIASIRNPTSPNPAIAKAVWETVGYGLGKTIGEWSPTPAPMPTPAPTPTPVPGEVVVKHLETIVDNHQEGAVVAALPFSSLWMPIIQWGLAYLAEHL